MSATESELKKAKTNNESTLRLCSGQAKLGKHKKEPGFYIIPSSFVLSSFRVFVMALSLAFQPQSLLVLSPLRCFAINYEP
jgi:hypothetical protein